MDFTKVFAYTLNFPGGTKEQYDQVVAKTNLGGKTAPGGIFHLASVDAEGVHIFDVWENKEAFDTFFRETLEPALKEVGVQPAEPKIWPVSNILEK